MSYVLVETNAAKCSMLIQGWDWQCGDINSYYVLDERRYCLPS